MLSPFGIRPMFGVFQDASGRRSRPRACPACHHWRKSRHENSQSLMARQRPDSRSMMFIHFPLSCVERSHRPPSSTVSHFAQATSVHAPGARDGVPVGGEACADAPGAPATASGTVRIAHFSNAVITRDPASGRRGDPRRGRGSFRHPGPPAAAPLDDIHSILQYIRIYTLPVRARAA